MATAVSCAVSSSVATASALDGLVVLAAQHGLGAADAVELGLPVHQVVGGQPQPGVAQVGLDGLGAARHLGLAAQRLELAAQLGGQVGQPGQVGRHRVELADRLFLALAVFEHAGGLFDERATVLRARLQDLRQPALPDDDVHLAADAGVAQQLLDIHQPATVAVDLVLAGAVAEHPPGDRHLGVLDRQRVVGVVDGDGHLGAAQRGPRRRAGEDDVLHLAAAQRLGALLAHHPGQGVDDVGLAGSVGTDDAGDARLEAQSRRRREGLEALQRQTLEVHGVPAYRRRRASRLTAPRNPGTRLGGSPTSRRRPCRPARRAAAAQQLQQTLTRVPRALRDHQHPAVGLVARRSRSDRVPAPATGSTSGNRRPGRIRAPRR